MSLTKKMKRKSFTFFTTKPINEKTPMYEHRIQGRTLYICRGDKTLLELNDDEIMKMLRALGIATSDFEKGYNWTPDVNVG